MLESFLKGCLENSAFNYLFTQIKATCQKNDTLEPMRIQDPKRTQGPMKTQAAMRINDPTWTQDPMRTNDRMTTQDPMRSQVSL